MDIGVGIRVYTTQLMICVQYVAHTYHHPVTLFASFNPVIILLQLSNYYYSVNNQLLLIWQYPLKHNMQKKEQIATQPTMSILICDI